MTKLQDLVGGDGNAELLASGFEFTEGPAWNERTKRLHFSDIPGDAIHTWDGKQVAEWRRPSRMANGLAFDHQGRLIACESATSHVTRTNLDETVETIASHFESRELNSPNDVVVKSDGSIYFTDPAGGRRYLTVSSGSGSFRFRASFASTRKQLSPRSSSPISIRQTVSVSRRMRGCSTSTTASGCTSAYST